MATPTIAPTGKQALLSIIQAAPLGSWFKVNSNVYQSVWGSTDYEPDFGAGVSSPDAQIRPWSSFAWDDSACRLILWGGGHANSSSNSMWIWEGKDQLWKRAFYPAKLTAAGNDTIDGGLSSPVSSHTYRNQVYLSVMNKFASFGGACQPSGAGWVLRDSGGTVLRSIICYIADLSKAGLGMVGGASGSNQKRNSTALVSVAGAQAWSARDWIGVGQSTSITNYLLTRINGYAQATVESGKDVVYLSCGPGGATSLYLVRIEFNSDASTDVLTIVGAPGSNGANSMGGAIDTTRKISIAAGTSTNPFFVWNLNTPGLSNYSISVPTSAISGTGASDVISAITSGSALGFLYDEKRNCFIIWLWGGMLYTLTPPSNLSNLGTSGWICTRISDNSASPRPLYTGEFVPSGAQETGIHGKWQRSATLDVYIGLQNSYDGNVWMYKPSDWTLPP